ncbi:MAG: RnfABCDGE type electron transport complex subunit D, partial [Steroidobacteraceae bacterium]
MLGAFFIATDPVTAAASDRGRLVYGAGIGLLTWAIRHAGHLPDGVAFAVLAMNLAAPLIDRWTVPRIHGQPR